MIIKNKLIYVGFGLFLTFLLVLPINYQSYSYETVSMPKKAKNTYMDIEISSDNTGSNKIFEVNNMFPGDEETGKFCVKVFYKENVTVKYNAFILPEYKKLAEVLKTKVVLEKSDEVLYDGLMEGMPDSINYNLSSRVKTNDDVCYLITVYLDKNVGNEYQNLPLAVNLEWSVEETKNLIDNPKTGDNIIIWIGIGVVSLICLILVIVVGKRGKKM